MKWNSFVSYPVCHLIFHRPCNATPNHKYPRWGEWEIVSIFEPHLEDAQCVLMSKYGQFQHGFRHFTWAVTVFVADGGNKLWINMRLMANDTSSNYHFAMVHLLQLLVWPSSTDHSSATSLLSPPAGQMCFTYFTYTKLAGSVQPREWSIGN